MVPLEPPEFPERDFRKEGQDLSPGTSVQLQGGKSGVVDRIPLVISLELSLLPHLKGATDITLHWSRAMQRSEVALEPGGRWSEKNMLRGG